MEHLSGSYANSVSTSEDSSSCATEICFLSSEFHDRISVVPYLDYLSRSDDSSSDVMETLPLYSPRRLGQQGVSQWSRTFIPLTTSNDSSSDVVEIPPSFVLETTKSASGISVDHVLIQC